MKICTCNQVYSTRLADCGLQEGVLGDTMSSKQGFLPSPPRFKPKLQALILLNLAVVIAVEVGFSGSDVGMTHKRLDGSGGHCLYREASFQRYAASHAGGSSFGSGHLVPSINQAIDCLWSQLSLIVRPVFPQRVENCVAGIHPVTAGLV